MPSSADARTRSEAAPAIAYGIRYPMRERETDVRGHADSHAIARAMEAAPRLFACIDANGTTRWASAAFASVTGHAPQDLEGRDFWSTLTVASAAAEIAQLMAHAHDDAPAAQPLTIVTRGGEIRRLAVEMVARGAPDGSVEEYILTATECMERAGAPRPPARGDARLRRVAANVPGVVFEYRLGRDAVGAFEYVSERASDVLAESPEALMRDPRLIFKLIDPPFRPRLLRSMLASRDALGLWTAELPIRTRSGQMKWVRVQSMPRRLDDGSVRWDGVIIDVSTQKQAEQAIQTLNEQLERRVAERTGELSAANRELEAFAHSVSHDLRAPLRAIDGFSRIMLEDYVGHLDARAVDLLGRVRGAAERMGALIDNLLVLSRATRGELNRVRTDLSQLAHGIVAELRGDAERPVDVRIEPGIVCLADPGLLRIALFNLIANAWKFCSKRERARIELGTLLQGEKTVYYVRDNGAGFDMKYAGKLFGVFQRMHSDREFEGTGVGLATVRRIVDRHGGAVWAQAEVNRGATFYFTLAGAEQRG